MFRFLLLSAAFVGAIKTETISGNSIAAAPSTVAKWNQPVLYVTFLDTFREQLLTEAIAWFQKNTCIRFKKRDPSTDKGPYLRIYTDERTTNRTWNNHFCKSELGVAMESEQKLKLDCVLTSWMVVREISHSLGLVYEHNRVDRDLHISIAHQLLILPAYSKSYDKFSESNPDFPYDFSSIMHLEPFYRHNPLKDPYWETPVMSPWNSNYFYSLGSARIQGNDIYGINEYYQCLSRCSNVPKPLCKNNGQQNPNDCSGCVCPPMYTGKLCGQKHPGIQPFNGVSCGETISAKNTTQTHAFYMKTKNNSRDSECYFFVEKTDGNMWIELILHYYYQSVENDKELRFCESGVQIYSHGMFTNNALTICDQQHLNSPRSRILSNSKIILRMYRSDPTNVGSVDTVIGFSYRQIVQ